MSPLLLLVTVIIVILQCGNAISKKFKVLKIQENGTYYLLHHTKGVLHRIPNIESVVELGINPSSVSESAVLTENNLQSMLINGTYSLGRTFPSLKRTAISPDEIMRVRVQKAISLEPPIFWLKSYYFPKMLNPALTLWQNKLLAVWRKGLYIKGFHFSWLENTTPSSGSPSTLQLSNSIHHNIGPKTHPKIFQHDFNNLMEDPRLVPLRNGSLLVLYTSKANLFSPAKQCYFLADINNATQRAYFSHSVIIDKANDSSWEAGQKNWVPFQPTDADPDTVLFIRQIHPLHIVTVTGIHANKTGIIKDVVVPQSNEVAPLLPWKTEFGVPLRGGSPAILLPQQQLYLAFFHTVAHLQPKNPKMRTYFMGACTFCPTFPYSLSATSVYPIVNSSLYETSWVEGGLSNIDYVLFPMGVVLDPSDEGKKRGKHVLVSLGHQDRSGMVMRLEVAGLLNSLEKISAC